MCSTLISSWQNRRSAFNHDWLKNKYLNRLDAFINRLEISDSDIFRLFRFLNDDFPEWKKQQTKIEDLLETFEMEMSPKSLFKKKPLNHCDNETRIWLGQLIHALWLARYPVKEWIHTAWNAFCDVNDQYNNIAEVLKSKKLNWESKDYRTALKLMIPHFLQFKKACEELSQAIGMFPHQILIV
jgi:hypothetical protein